jgi:hypothetical protein
MNREKKSRIKKSENCGKGIFLKKPFAGFNHKYNLRLRDSVGSSQGRPHVASLSFLPINTNVQKKFLIIIIVIFCIISY